MLSRLAKFLLAMTALSPAGITWSVTDYSRRGFHQDQFIVLAGATILWLICLLLLSIARRSLTKVSIKVETIKVVDNEVVAYVVTYLFPLVAPAADISLVSQAFVLFVLALVLSTSHAFTFNPVLTLAGYHFYEMQCSSGVSYLMLSKNDITDVAAVKNVGRLSKHLMLDLS